MPPDALAMNTGAPGLAVDQQSQIEFALDVQPFFDQQALYDAPLRARLRRDQVHSQDLRRDFRSFVGRTRQLHAPAFAAPSRVNLRFHHTHLGLQAAARLPALPLW